MKKILIPIILCVLFLSAVNAAHAAKIKVEPKQRVGEQYRLYEAELTLPYFEEDTNNDDQVKVDAIISTPSGKKVILPSFCTKNEKRRYSKWEMHFAPRETGKYSYYFKVDSVSLQAETGSYSFAVKRTEDKGFLQKVKKNPYYLMFDSGEFFFGIGHNIAWTNNSSPRLFDRYFEKLQQNGGNFTRVWLCSWSFPLEWGELGEYDESVARSLDELLELAAKRGIYIMLCFDTYGSLMAEKGHWNEDNWYKNPYNKEVGGPCAKPEDFFTDLDAIRHYKNKLRYIVSRWGHSPNIAAFEFWNEYNAPVKWVEEMADYIKSIDPYGHFVTTSHGYPWGKVIDEDKVWSLKDIGMVTIHTYANSSEYGLVPLIAQKSREISIKYKKPFIFSEVGIDAGKGDRKLDPEGTGTALHNSIWASALSRSFGTAMNWWWDSYVRPKDLYYHYKGLAAFLKDTNWDVYLVDYPDISPIVVKADEKNGPIYRDVKIRPEQKWGKTSTDNIVVLCTGELSGTSMPNKYLHGKSKPEMQSDHIFHVDYPVDGEFILKIGTVSQAGNLHVYIDGRKVASKKFPAGSDKDGPWKMSTYLEKYDVYQCIYNENFKVKVSKGKHTIKLRNAGKDWIGIEKITLTNYLNHNYSKARCTGLIVGEEMLFWIQNKKYNWKNVLNKRKPGPINGAYFKVFDIENGTYSVEWWDTIKGEIIMKEDGCAVDNVLTINVPDFEQDIACKIKR